MRSFAAIVAVAIGALGLAPSAAAEDKRELAVITLESFGQPEVMRIIGPDGAPVRTLFSRTSNFGNNAPSWSPDEKTIAYGEGGQLFTVPSAGGAEKPLTMGSLPAFSPTADEVAFRRDNNLWVIRADGTGEHSIAGPFTGWGASPPSWAPDGTSLALHAQGAILRVPAAGGASTPIVSPGAGEVVSRPAFAPDGARIAFSRENQTGIDQLVVRNLATGADTIAWQAPNDKLGFASSIGGITWSADSERIAYAELDTSQTPPLNRVVSVMSDGSGGRKVLITTGLVQGVGWANAPRRPSYFVRHVEVAQAISPLLEPLLPFDPLLPDPYTFHWSRPTAFSFGIPLIAEKSTLLRLYVGDATLAPGSTVVRSMKYSVVDPSTGVDYGAGQSQAVDVTAPGVAPRQQIPSGAINVWLPPDTVKSGASRTFTVEVNAGEAESECAGCYPHGNRATVSDINPADGGRVVIAPVPIFLITPDTQTVLKPSESDLLAAVERAHAMLPVPDDGISIAPSPGGLLIDQKKLEEDGGCDHMLARLMEWRATPGESGPGASPVQGSGAIRWVGYAPKPLSPANVPVCRGKGNLPGTNLVLLGPEAEFFAHELGHTLGLVHTTGLPGSLVAAGAVPLPYGPGIGGVGYDNEIAGVTTVYPAATTGDLMSYSADKWTSPFTWGRMDQDIRSAAGAVQSHGTAARAAASARTSRARRLVAGVLSGGDTEIIDSLVTESDAEPGAGAVQARVVARNKRGRALARTAIRGTPVQEEGQDAASLPFLVTLPAKKRIAAVEVVPEGGGKPLAKARASRHAPKGRLRGLRKRMSASKPLTIRWKATDRDRGDELTVIVLARRGRQAWRSVAMGPAKGSISVDPASLGKGKRLRVRLRIGDGFRTADSRTKRITLRP